MSDLPRSWVWEDECIAQGYRQPIVPEAWSSAPVCSAYRMLGSSMHRCWRLPGHTGRHADYDTFGFVRAVWERTTP